VNIARTEAALQKAADELATRLLERDSAAADEMVRPANESMAASG